MRALATSALSLFVLATASIAHAEPTSQECIQAADSGQVARDEGKLVTARSTFITCAATSCPAVIKKQCSEWLIEVEKQTPTVNFVAKDASGRELIDVVVTVDERVVAKKIDGRAVQVDPGQHMVRFRLGESGQTTESNVIFRSGEKDRLVELKFPPAPSPVAKPAEPHQVDPAPAVVAPPKADRNAGLRVPLVAWVGLGGAAVGTGTLIAFATLADGQERDLRRTCAPSCSSSDRDSLHTKVVVGNIGLGVAVTGLAVTIVSTVLANRAPASPATSGIGVTPLAGGAAASFVSAF